MLEIAIKYRKLELKGQRATKKVLQNIKCQADFPYAKIKCMGGDATEEELVQILSQVVSKEKSLAEMEFDLVRIKEMHALQCFFVKYSKCTSWQYAQKRYDTRWCCTYSGFPKIRTKIISSMFLILHPMFSEKITMLGGRYFFIFIQNSTPLKKNVDSYIWVHHYCLYYILTRLTILFRYPTFTGKESMQGFRR